MSQPYIGEIRLFAGNFPPAGWLFCDGQLMPISENEALFALLGTAYGGDGQETFALPDMRGRVPLHAGTNTADSVTYPLAAVGGSETVTLTTAQVPSHTHGMRASTNAASPAYTASTGVLAKTAGANVYALVPTGVGPMKANSVLSGGGGQPHDNIAPYLCVNYIISLFGIYPFET